ncbi:hypothetical protein HNQ51_002536 [Inhella inkyongensis]|uniref:Uncharacterized protein n=1 Tax=Inhella inkyongensis TaxID=392593 RepID=A0A840S220_9BURK|nr:hypothetical protein [Inhella inkyongensis]MBB5205217.1 hypothetical protein [Inhella inkyongensis]
MSQTLNTQKSSKYDDLCTYVREKSKARGAFVMVMDGEKGHGFAVQASSEDLERLPGMLRNLAAQVESRIRTELRTLN